MKLKSLKRISAVLTMMLALPSAAVTGAEPNEVIYYENHFNDGDGMGIFSGEGSTFSVENGMGKIVTPIQANGTSYVYASMGSDKPLHRISDGEIDTLEVKVKFDKPSKNFLFGPYDTSSGSEKKYNAILKYGDTIGLSLRGADEVSFSSDFNMKPGKWHQLYFVFNNDKYDLYIGGKKAAASVGLKGKNNTDTLTQIDKFMFAGQKESAVEQVTWIDDIIAQKLAPIYLMESSIQNGAENVSADSARELVLDFNTIIDAASLGNINITAGSRSLSAAEYSASLDESDSTKVIINFNCDLSSATHYTVDYTGVKDVINGTESNSAEGTLSFTTENKEIPLKVMSENQTNVSPFAPVTIVFNKIVSAEDLNKRISISPEAETETEVIDNSVIIKPKYNWIANKDYTVSFSGLTAADGSAVDEAASSIEFSTVADPYASAERSVDFSWYKNNLLDAEKAKKTGICGMSFDGKIKEVDWFAKNNGKPPFLYKDSIGKDDDVLTGQMLYMYSSKRSNAIVYELESGLGSFVFHTGEKIAGDGNAATLSFYTAKDGADFKDDSAYEEVSYVKSGTPSDKWQEFTYTVTACDPTVRYLKVVISKQDGVTAESIYTPMLMGAAMKPYKPEKITVYKGENTEPDTVELTFDGFLDLASISKDKFAVPDNSVLEAQIVSAKDSNCPAVQLKLAKKLADKKAYNITVSGLSDIFGNTVEESGKEIVADNPFVTIDAEFDAVGEKITGAVYLPQDNKYIGKTANVIIAYYDGKALSKCYVQSVNLKQGENDFEITADMPGADDVAKVMLWTLDENMAPICMPNNVKTAL